MVSPWFCYIFEYVVYKIVFHLLLWSKLILCFHSLVNIQLCYFINKCCWWLFFSEALPTGYLHEAKSRQEKEHRIVLPPQSRKILNTKSYRTALNELTQLMQVNSDFCFYIHCKFVFCDNKMPNYIYFKLFNKASIPLFNSVIILILYKINTSR